jgi:biopolymer transport protein ExbD
MRRGDLAMKGVAHALVRVHRGGIAVSGSISSGAKAEPNLTPILDMVFQLITFFMLVINFKSAEMDLSLKLPVIGSARPVPSAGRVLVLNVKVDDEHPRGCLSVYGLPNQNIESYLAKEAQTSLLAARMTPANIADHGGLPETIMIRADQSTRFAVLKRVVKCAQDNGYRKFAFKVTSKAE